MPFRWRVWTIKLQKTTTAGTLLQKASYQNLFTWDTTVTPMPLGPAPYLCWAAQAGPGWQATSQWPAALASWRLCLPTVSIGPRCAREHSSSTGIPQNNHTSASTHAWGGGFHVNPCYGQNDIHVVKQMLVPLWHSANEHMRSEMDSCWGYSNKNSMTLCSLRGSNLLLPPGPPRVPEEAGRSFPGAEASEVLPHYLGATSNPRGREEPPLPSVFLLAGSKQCFCKDYTETVLTTDRVSPNMSSKFGLRNHLLGKRGLQMFGEVWVFFSVCLFVFLSLEWLSYLVLPWYAFRAQ